MILLLDTSTQGKTIIGLGRSGGVRAKKVYTSRYHLTDTLLAKIGEFFSRSGISLDDVTGIVVVTGPGPFSALRGALTIANTLSWARGIPLCGLQRPEFHDFSDLLEKGQKRLKVFSHPLLPFYGKEPSLGDTRK